MWSTSKAMEKEIYCLFRSRVNNTQIMTDFMDNDFIEWQGFGLDKHSS